MTMKQTPAVKPQAAAGAPVKPRGKAKAKKPMSRAAAVLITAFVFVLLLGGAGACLWFNVGGAAELVMKLTPQYKATLAELDTGKAGQELQRQKLQLQADALASSEKALAKREADMAAREDKLKANQAALDAKLAKARTRDELNQTTIAVYTAMQPSVAAKMLDSANTLQEAAAILKLLPDETIAAILSEMDSKKALELSKLIAQ